MRRSWSLIAFSGLLLSVGYCQTNPAAAFELEAMERFAKQPSTRVVWSEEVDRIVAGTATAVITAVILEDATTTRQMRGIRIDLTDGPTEDQVYAAETHLERVIAEMDEISTHIPGFFTNSERVRAPNRCFGSGIFLLARREGAHIFGASQCSMADGWFGLTVSTRSATVPGSGTATVRFTGLAPAPFAAAIVRARDLLNKR
jgi:hypothetical protein